MIKQEEMLKFCDKTGALKVTEEYLKLLDSKSFIFAPYNKIPVEYKLLPRTGDNISCGIYLYEKEGELYDNAKKIIDKTIEKEKTRIDNGDGTYRYPDQCQKCKSGKGN